MLVAIDGAPVFMKSYGYANLELGVKNTKDTKFCIGSITKQFTSVAIFILYEKGTLKLDDKISKYLKNLPTAWSNITIHQLLTHTSGLMHSFASDQFKKDMSKPQSIDEVIGSFYDKPLVTKPGEKMHYSGVGYFILTKIIEEVSGMPYEAFLYQEIFSKAGMKNTGVYNPSFININVASGYQMNDNEIRNADFIYLPNLTGGGSLYSTLEDLLKWSILFNSDKLLCNSTKKILLTPVFDDMACGLKSGPFKLDKKDNLAEKIPDSVFRMAHGGWVPGFLSHIDMFPERKILIVKLANGDYSKEFYGEKFIHLVLNEVYRNSQ